MEYTDNPRKIYSKVEIIYSDQEISGTISASASSNSLISHPSEVYEGNISPTCKACTMDGNSTMDGSFQMIDDGCVLGWWSGELSGSDGTFTNAPYLDVILANRPVINWFILSDNKLNQYPVDFDIIVMLDDIVKNTIEIRNNLSTQIRISTNTEEANRIRLKVYKWSTPNACIKILQSYAMLSETYLESEIESFEISEETSTEDGDYTLSSNQLSLTLYNKDRKFDRGYLKSLMTLDRKIKPMIGIEKNGVIEYTPLGTFYSDEWKMAQDSLWVKLTAVDRLLRFQNKEYLGHELVENTTLYDIALDILENSGLEPNEYEISKSLQYITLDIVSLPRSTIWDALEEVAIAGLCKIYIDRNNKLRIISDLDEKAETDIEINKSNTFKYESNIALTKFANKVYVDYSEQSPGDTLVEIASATISLDANESKSITISYDTDAAYINATTTVRNFIITNLKEGVNACSLTVTNTANIRQTGPISITGYMLNTTYTTISAEDPDSISEYGVVEYTHPSSSLIQSYAQAETIANYLLNKLKAGEGTITVEWRGDPSLELEKTYTLKDRFNDGLILVAEYNKITFDGSLKEETRGRKLIEEEN